MVDQAEIYRMARSEDVEERKKAVNLLFNNFAVLPDKETAWDDLHRLTQDKNEVVRLMAAYTLVAVFTHIPDKEKALEDLQRLVGELKPAGEHDRNQRNDLQRLNGGECKPAGEHDMLYGISGSTSRKEGMHILYHDHLPSYLPRYTSYVKAYEIKRKCRVEYYNPMEVNREYSLKIGILRKEFEEKPFLGTEVRWGNIKFIAKEIEPEVEIVPVSTFFVFAPTKITLKIKANQDECIDFKMRPTSSPDNPKTSIGIEFLYKNESIGKINIDVKIQNKFRIVDNIKISHEKWGEVLAIGGGLTTIGIYLHFSSLLFESLEYASHLGFLLITFSLLAFCLGIYLGKNKSRKVSEVFE